MSDPFDCALETVFGIFGVDATYTPAEAAGVALRVVLKRPDKAVDVGLSGLHVPSWQAEARAAELPNGAAKGDKLQVAGTTFVVRQIAFDADRRLVTLDLDPA